MTYGTIKVDTITFTSDGVDKSVAISGLVQNPTFTGNVTVTGTISGNTVRGQTVSGVTITGTTAQFTSGTFVSLTGTTLQGTTATYTTGSFTSLTGTTSRGTTANFTTGTFTSLTGTTATFTTGNFNSITGGIATITSGVFATGNTTNPSISFSGDSDTGIYSRGANSIAITNSGVTRFTITDSGIVRIGPGSTQTLASAPGAAAANVYFDGVAPTPNSSTYQGVTIVSRGGDVFGGAAVESLSFYSAGWDSYASITHGTSGFGDNLILSGSDDITISANARGIVYGETSAELQAGGGGLQRLIAKTNELVINDIGSDYDFRVEGDTNANLFFVDASTERIGIGTSSPLQTLHVQGGSANTDDSLIRIGIASAFNSLLIGYSGTGDITDEAPAIYATSTAGSTGSAGHIAYKARSGTLRDHIFYTGTTPTERLRITSTGNVGIGTGTSTPGGTLEVKAATSVAPFVASGPSSEFARIDSSGRLLVGTSSAPQSFEGGATIGVQVEHTGSSNKNLLRLVSNAVSNWPAVLSFARSRGTSNGAVTALSSGDNLGVISFGGADGTNYLVGASIVATVDGTPGANDMPGRLVFSTTADGASSPTERMRINSAGQILFNTTSFDAANPGVFINSTADTYITADSATPLYINRKTNDGTLVSLRQANIEEGAISVSGTTVTYGGGHLARWSQLTNDEDASSILKGTVMSNLDEMCEWGEEDNEQLNKTKVSDVEGDPNVAGVFVSTSFSDDGPLDFFVAMTGDMIIRIAEGVTVQRGDLLMSAGDGTAKPQDDDIIRSKTIAKVTSTHVTCTYDDGSYCVPCVLMAC
jgi:hypothetical protein